MASARLEDWVERLKTGTLDVSDLKTLERLKMDQLVDRLSRRYPVRFLEGQIRNKREVGLAQRRRGRKYIRCLFLTDESGRLTALSTMTFLRIRPSSHPANTVQLSSGAGFSLYRDPDGWKIKLVEERTVSLTEAALRKRGWRLHPDAKRALKP